MRLLVDENAPVQIVPALVAVLPAHDVQHVQDIGWKGKPDTFLLRDAAGAGYDVLLTIDRRQLEVPDELQAIRRSGLHHVTFPQGKGVEGLARSIGAVIAQMPAIIRDLAAAPAQRLVRITRPASTKRYEVVDPTTLPSWRR